VNVVPAASDLPKLEEVKPVLAPPAAQVISKAEVQAPLRAKVFVPKHKKGDYMVDHVDRFDLFIKRASVLQSERELFFVDSLNNVHDQATLFDDMRQDNMEMSFDDLLAKFTLVVDRLTLAKVLARRDKISQMRNENAKDFLTRFRRFIRLLKRYENVSDASVAEMFLNKLRYSNDIRILLPKEGYSIEDIEEKAELVEKMKGAF
jgi:hypothetical protein